MVTTFNVADLHGRFDLLEKAIEKIEAYPDVEKGVVVFTGDYIDRGPQSMQVIDRLMKGPSDSEKWKWVCLKGNHEVFLEDYYYKHSTHDAHSRDMWWYTMNGGNTTLLSYNYDGLSLHELLSFPQNLIPKEHAEFIRDMPYYYEDKARVFVHAMVHWGTALEYQQPETFTWEVYDPDAEGGWWDSDYEVWKAVVHGHDQDAKHPVHYELRHNYDTFAWFIGRLVIGVWDEDGTQPIDNIEVIGRANREYVMEKERWIG
jgi:serine/threonine protein phosphatase 1